MGVKVDWRKFARGDPDYRRMLGSQLNPTTVSQSLLGPTGAGISNEGATSAAGQSLLARARNVTNKEAFQTRMSGLGYNGKLLGQGVRSTGPAVSSSDLVQAMMTDRAEALRAQKAQRGQEQEQIDLVRGKTDEVVGGARAYAQGIRDEGSTFRAGVREGAGSGIEEIRQTARDIPGYADQRANADIGAVEQAKAGAKAEYSDTTATAVEEGRFGVRDSIARQKSQLLAQASQRGLGANDPQVMNELRRIDAEGVSKLGRLSNQASMAYNDSVAKLNQYYDSMASNVRASATASTTGARVSKLSGLIAAQQAQTSVDRFLDGSRQASDQMASQLRTQADMWELQGYKDVGKLLRDRTIAYSPIADIVAASFSLGKSDMAEQGPQYSLNQGSAGGMLNSAGASARVFAPYRGGTHNPASARRAPRTAYEGANRRARGNQQVRAAQATAVNSELPIGKGYDAYPVAPDFNMA